jgi:hypothetical protein
MFYLHKFFQEKSMYLKDTANKKQTKQKTKNNP